MEIAEQANIKMPSILRHFLFFTTGISGLAYLFKGQEEVGFGFSIMLVVSGVLSALASYGFISLLADIKKAKTWCNFCKTVTNRIKYLINDRNN
tara:strand:- start:3834 stop:4115 length:282 start_codon:yes stop_codon:yes gene_type:complete